MTQLPEPLRLSRGKRALFAAIYLLLLTLVTLGAGEIAVRARGYRPWTRHFYQAQVSPGGKFFVKDPVLGYGHLPGAYTVTLADGYAFNVTHLANGLRVTRPIDAYRNLETRKGMWVFGCSFTHGWSLNDPETFPWLLQERFPQYDVVNFGVSGYGQVHSLLQFRDALQRGRLPAVIIVTYASFHDERNTFLRSRRKTVAAYNRLGPLVQPYARLARNGTLNFALADVEYREFPLMRHSALAHFLEQKYDEWEEALARSHEVSKVLILEMERLARARGITFVLAGIGYDSLSRDILAFASARGISTVDIAVDLQLRENRNYPHEGHPGPLANQRYAAGLESFLRSNVVK